MDFTTTLKNTFARLDNLAVDALFDLEAGENLVITVSRDAIGDITEEILKEHVLIAGTFSDGYHVELLVKKAFIEKNGEGAGLRVAINRSLHAKGWPLDKELVDTTLISTVEGVTRLTEGFPKVTEATGEIAEWAKPYADLFSKGVGILGGIVERRVPTPTTPATGSVA